MKAAIVCANASQYCQLTADVQSCLKAKGTAAQISVFTSGEQFLSDHPQEYDLVFAQTKLPGTGGIEMCRKLRKLGCTCAITLVSDTGDDAVLGYEVQAVAYLVLPYTCQQMIQAIEKCLIFLSVSHQNAIIIKDKDGSTKIPLRQIRFIDAQDHLITYHTSIGEICSASRLSLSALEKELSSKGFARCSQSCLVNLEWVEKISGEYLTVDQNRIKISRSKRQEFLERLEEAWQSQYVLSPSLLPA